MSNDWKERAVLVTGAGGFIGSHLAERLVERGANVTAFVHYNAQGAPGWLDDSPLRPDMSVVAGDVCDRDSVMEAGREAELIFHLAALIAIPYSYSAPVSYVRTNIEGTLNVLQAARACGTRRLVVTSTSEVYGTAQYTPIDEKHPLCGQSPYSASKIGADKQAEAFYRSFNVPVVTVRPFNTFGPRQSARAIIPTIVTQALHGNVIRVGNVHPTRDLNYVSNMVDGFLLAATREAVTGETINFGSGSEISIRDLVSLVAQLMGKELQVVTDVERQRPEASEVDRLVADSSLARQLLGWAPAVTLEEGLQRTIEWLSRNLDRYRPEVYAV